MGQGQSQPRKITVINEEAAGVIKISDSVLQRLNNEIEGQGQQQQQQQSQNQHQQQQAPPPPPSQAPPPQSQQQIPPAGGQLPPMVDNPHSLSALKMAAMKEAELRNVESYWQERVEDLRNQKLKESTIDEASFNSTVAHIDKLFLKSRGQPICQDQRHAVMLCYKENSGKTLLCAEAVKAFANCAQSARLGALAENQSRSTG